jgi:hypothetical protein
MAVMRNDARPIGEDLPRNPIGEDEPPRPAEPDTRDSLKHDRQSHIVNPRAEDDARRLDDDTDPTMPTGDSTLNTKI